MKIAALATLLTAIAGLASAADASFQCQISSAYEVLEDDEPVQSGHATRMMAQNRVDVLIHDGRALVTTTLYGGVETREFAILLVSDSMNGWRLMRNDEGPASTATMVIDIRTWGLKDQSERLRIAVYYPSHLGLGTYTQLFGEIGIGIGKAKPADR